MSPTDYIKAHQRLWALRRGISVDAKGYVTTVDENLLEPLSPEARHQFNNADGNELTSKGANPPKMHALHSSSALAANVFHYWRNRDKAALAHAMEIPSPNIDTLEFEKLSPICTPVERTLFPRDPNIDIVLSYSTGPAKEIGIESKFREAYGVHEGLREAYFRVHRLWTGIQHCRALAERFRQPKKAVGLNIPQLLKHLLGLKNRSPIGKFWLVYLWYAAPTSDQGEHFQQLAMFKATLAADNIRFHFMTYQELICRLAGVVRSEHSSYIDYLADRYL
jgi:hypothetical protein